MTIFDATIEKIDTLVATQFEELKAQAAKANTEIEAVYDDIRQSDMSAICKEMAGKYFEQKLLNLEKEIERHFENAD